MIPEAVPPFVRKSSLRLFAAIFVAVVLPKLEAAQSVTLAWDPNSEPDVVGYTLYYGEQSGAYTQALDAGSNTTLTVPALLEGHSYYFAVTARNLLGIESDFSTEVPYTVPGSGGNNPPTANDSVIQGSEDQAIAVLLSAADPDGNPITFEIVTVPQYGTLSGTAPNLMYRSNTNYSGPDSFTFKVNDGMADSGVATVSITVMPVNDAPVASNSTLNTAEDTGIPVVLGASDADGDALSYVVVSPPVHGTLSGTAPNLTYRPETDYSGPDVFTFKANDGAVDSGVTTVAVTVTAVNDPPVALGRTLTTAENAAVAVALSGSDAEGDALSYVVLSPPSHGKLTGTAPNLTYHPAADYSGPDSFTFKSTDGAADSVVATVEITVLELSPNVEISLTSSGLQLTWNSIPGRSYRVYYFDDLASTNFVAADIILSESLLTYWQDWPSSFGSGRFYLIELIDP